MSEGFGGFMFGPPPPEVVAAIQAQQEHRHMHMTDNTHAIKQLLDGLNEEQLRALDLLLANCGDARTVMFFRGRIEMLQQIKFDICPCGTNHDDELAEMGTHEKPPTQPNTATEHKGRVIEDVPLPDGQVVDMSLPDDGEELDALMVEYAVEANPLHGGDMLKHAPMVASPFRCSNCGIGIASLEDRMRRPKGIEGCSGCQQKSAWG